MGRGGHGARREAGLVVFSVGFDLQVADQFAVARFFPQHEVRQLLRGGGDHLSASTAQALQPA